MQHTILQCICTEFPRAKAVIACRGEDVARVEPYAQGLRIVPDKLPSVLEWADFALNVSGTVSLHVMRHATPMIGMYKTNLLSMLAAKIVLTTPFRLLPNLIAGKHIVPEFIPCGNIAMQIGELAAELLSDEEEMEEMRSQLQKEAAIYATHDPSIEAAEIILSFSNNN